VKVRVLYEDSLAPNGAPVNYAPHRLLLNCLFDRMEIKAMLDAVYGRAEFYLLANLVVAHPCNGNANVFKQLTKNRETFANSQIAPVACLDSDKIDRLLKVAERTCKVLRREALWDQCEFKGNKAFVLLERNLEDILQIAQKQGANFGVEELNSALNKNLADRDALVSRIANDPGLRVKMLTAMPSFGYLVEKTAALALIT